MSNSVKFIHSCGPLTYYEEGDVIDKKDNKYLVRWYDDIDEKFREEWMLESDVKFPEFKDLPGI